MKDKYIASCSFGKDSIATILLALEHGEPLDEIFYTELMFDNEKQISAEQPDHRKFIYETAIPYFEKRGIHVEIGRPEHDYLWTFNKRITRGAHEGKKRGFLLMGMCDMSRDCKLPAISKYNRQVKEDGYRAIHYVGIASDEPKRLKYQAEHNPDNISLMAKYGITEAQAVELCKEKGLYSPIYQYAKRNGCWFCPNARRGELRRLYDLRPEYLCKLAEMEKDPDIVEPYFQQFTKTKISEILEQFYWEDQQMDIFDYLKDL